MKKNTNQLFRFMNLRAPEDNNYYVSELQALADTAQNDLINKLNEIRDTENDGKTALTTKQLRSLSNKYTKQLNDLRGKVPAFPTESLDNLKKLDLGKLALEWFDKRHNLTLKKMNELNHNYNQDEFTKFFNFMLKEKLETILFKQPVDKDKTAFISFVLIMGKLMHKKEDGEEITLSDLTKVKRNRLAFDLSSLDLQRFQKQVVGYIRENQAKLSPSKPNTKSEVVIKKETRKDLIEYINALKSAGDLVRQSKLQAKKELSLIKADYDKYHTKLSILKKEKTTKEVEIEKAVIISKVLTNIVDAAQIINTTETMSNYCNLMNKMTSPAEVKRLDEDVKAIDAEITKLTANPAVASFATVLEEESFLEKKGKKIFDANLKLLPGYKILLQPNLPYIKTILPQIKMIQAENMWSDFVLVGPLIGILVQISNQLCAEIKDQMNNPVVSLFDNIEERGPNDSDLHPIFRAAGIGDLVYAKTELLHYDAREIAHIENVQQGELYRREHCTETEQITLEETETFKETSTTKDLQTSNRFELEAKSQESISQDFSIDAGLNVSATYGMVSMDASLNAGFSMNKTSSNSKAMKTAQEVINRTIEKTQYSFREKLSMISSKKIIETTVHEIDYTRSTNAYSNVFKWVEKTHHVELRHYGSRLMLEFYIPEPGMGILASADAAHTDVSPPPPFDFGPHDIDEYNYLCLAEIYKAVDIDPPPAATVSVGYAWASTPDESADERGEDTHSGYIQLPDLYEPERYLVYGTGLNGCEIFWLHVGIGGKAIFDSYYHGFFTSDGYFDPDVQVISEAGLPVTIRASEHFDKTASVNIQLICKRSEELLTKWKIDTYANLKEAYDALVRDYEGKLAGQTVQISGHNPQINRQREKAELAKWCITSLRNTSLNFDSIIKVRIDNDVKIEIDPIQGESDAEIVDFFESCFEWSEMTYFLYPYFLGRRELWDHKLALTNPDPIHEKFLKSGAAKVLVPVTPGMEEKVLYFINPTNHGLDELSRIRWGVPETYDELTGELNITQINLIDEILLSRSIELAQGVGTIAVVRNYTQVTINNIEGALLNWELTPLDVTRQIFIKGIPYSIAQVDDSETFHLDRPYEGTDDSDTKFLIGSVRLGEPWEETIPTSLVILSSEIGKLN